MEEASPDTPAARTQSPTRRATRWSHTFAGFHPPPPALTPSLILLFSLKCSRLPFPRSFTALLADPLTPPNPTQARRLHFAASKPAARLLQSISLIHTCEPLLEQWVRTDHLTSLVVLPGTRSTLHCTLHTAPGCPQAAVPPPAKAPCCTQHPPTPPHSSGSLRLHRVTGPYTLCAPGLIWRSAME